MPSDVPLSLGVIASFFRCGDPLLAAKNYVKSCLAASRNGVKRDHSDFAFNKFLAGAWDANAHAAGPRGSGFCIGRFVLASAQTTLKPCSSRFTTKGHSIQRRALKKSMYSASTFMNS